MSLKKTS